eukprot:177001-Amphidinium_carterae.5
MAESTSASFVRSKITMAVVQYIYTCSSGSAMFQPNPAERLEDVICATKPEEGNQMETVVKGSHLFWTRSSMPVHPGPTAFAHQGSGLIRFQCTREDKMA